MAAERLRRVFGPVRRRTTLAATVFTLVAASGAALTFWVVLRVTLEGNVQSTAEIRARDIASLAQQGRLPVPLSFPGEDIGLAQVVDASGTVIAASPNLSGEPRIAAFLPRGNAPSAQTVRSLPIGDGQRFRVVAYAANTPTGPVTVYAALSLATVDDAVGTVGLALAVGVPALVGIIGVVTWLLTGRALQPVETIRAQAAEITSHDPVRRVPVLNTHDEIERLATTMNDMLDRLHDAADRQRRFIDDASHELRSPLASIRTQLEVSLAHPASTNWPAMAADLLEDQSRVEHLVQDLLLLARLDGSNPTPEWSTVNLFDLTSAELRRPPDRVAVSVEGATTVVDGDTQLLRRVVRNLVDNAVQHARTSVDVTIHPDADQAVLQIRDDGPGIPPTERERVFERFTRLDESRATDYGGAGLGLSIVRRLVTIHHGTVRVVDTPVGACFEVRIPLHQAGNAEAAAPSSSPDQ